MVPICKECGEEDCFCASKETEDRLLPVCKHCRDQEWEALDAEDWMHKEMERRRRVREGLPEESQEEESQEEESQEEE